MDAGWQIPQQEQLIKAVQMLAAELRELRAIVQKIEAKIPSRPA